MFKSYWPFYYAIAIILAVSLYQQYYLKTLQSISYSEFIEAIEADRIKSVEIGQIEIQGEYKEAQQKNENVKTQFFSTNTVEDKDLLERLNKHNVQFSGRQESQCLSSILAWVLPLVFLYFIWSFLFKKIATGAGPGGAMMGLTKSKARLFFEQDIKVTFADVAGVDEVKEDLQQIVEFLKNSQKSTRLGGRSPKGTLLIGPPGTGKTLLARALAGEAGVPFFSINGSEFVEMFVGLGAARVRDLFKEARAKAPCIIFIDEIDALGKSRSYDYLPGGSHDEKEQTLHQLLAEIDGFDPSTGIIVLAATNRPEVLDPALLRAGRFDRQILVPLPDQKGREEILKVHLKKITSDPEIKLSEIAALTSGFSGADLENVVNEAAIIASRRNANYVNRDDFTVAIERLIAGLERKSRHINPEEKNRVAYHEMGHASVALSLKVPERIHKVSVIPRGVGTLGYTIQRPLEDRYLIVQSELLNRICVLLGGRASEEVFLKEVSTGAGDDLVKATEMARSMVVHFGMSQNLGLASLEDARKAQIPISMPRSFGSIGDYGQETADTIDKEVRQILDKCYQKSRSIIQQNKMFIEKGVEELMRSETLNEQKILDLARAHLVVYTNPQE